MRDVGSLRTFAPFFREHSLLSTVPKFFKMEVEQSFVDFVGIPVTSLKLYLRTFAPFVREHSLLSTVPKFFKMEVEQSFVDFVGIPVTSLKLY